jgi:hypothetical protein
MDEVLVAIRNLRLVNEANPMEEFFKGLLFIGFGVGLIALLSKLFDS